MTDNYYATLFHTVSEGAVRAILGMPRAVPLTPRQMAASLRVVFYPHVTESARVRAFAGRLADALTRCGAAVVPYEEALIPGSRDKLQEGLVVITAGEAAAGNLAVDHVSNLRSTTLVGIVDGPCPADLQQQLQDKLNSVVKALAWNVVQVVMFVDEDAWTVCTMNGAIVRFGNDEDFDHEVLSILVPKLAAPVVPPHAADFDMREGELDVSANGCAAYAGDFASSGPAWAGTGLMLFHTSMESLEFRSRFYQRVVQAYLDHRSGMSYGFLARQLPVELEPALTLKEARQRLTAVDWTVERHTMLGDDLYIRVDVQGGPLVVRVPPVWVLTTRSGCDKSNLDVRRDVVLMGLSGGKILFETPSGTSTRIDCKPSYDTLTILAHAVANAIVAAVLLKMLPGSRFPAMLRQSGLALAHWHGTIDRSALPEGYVVHGEHNPPVSCSTFQSAIYALTGKLQALEQSLEQGREFAGDVHVEPFHGINITGPSLGELARWTLRTVESSAVHQFSIQAAREYRGETE